MQDCKTLRERCHVNTNDDSDCFVGVKATSEDAIVYFPLGYHLPDSEQDLKKDIRRLFRVLASFISKESKVSLMKKNEVPQIANFPLQAYLEIIDFYLLNNGYYVEKEFRFKINAKGKINWAKTIKTQKPYVQDNSFIYLTQVVRSSSPSDKNLITQINKYCVYESFERLGWLYGINMPERPTYKLEKTKWIAFLNDKFAQSNNERDKALFKSMIMMIMCLDEKSTHDKQFYFGTERFEYVWQGMIDKVFGISGKEAYFPRATWKERCGNGMPKHTLEPDSIMIIGDKYYILDAKYYRYGYTGNADHLPGSADINKQITYGEYIETNCKPGDDKLFNAFIMPFDSKANVFGIDSWCGNVAEATGDWRSIPFKRYEKIQGILIDVRWLMLRLDGNHEREKKVLASEIENGSHFS